MAAEPPMLETVTYLEMTSPDDLRPSPVVPAVSLEQVAHSSPLIPSTTVRIGAPYRWPSSIWSAERWAEYVLPTRREFWLIRHDGEIAGLADFEGRRGGQLEITTFGLVPEFVGHGIGGYALTLVVRQAWRYPAHGGEVMRVWLHTSDLDHPHALRNYHRRGFRTFRTEPGQRM